MKRSVLSIGLSSLLVIACSTSPSPSGRADVADLVIVNGKVFTADPGATTGAEAVAIKGNAVLRVGTTAEITALAGPSTETIDAHGGSVVPGFDDNHVHFVSASLGLDRAGLHDAETLVDVARTIREFATAHPAQPWVLGRGWFYAPFPGASPRGSSSTRSSPIVRPSWSRTTRTRGGRTRRPSNWRVSRATRRIRRTASS